MEYYAPGVTPEQVELYERFVRARRHLFPGAVIPHVDRDVNPLMWSCRFCGNEWSAKEVPSRCRTCGAPRGK